MAKKLTKYHTVLHNIEGLTNADLNIIRTALALASGTVGWSCADRLLAKILLDEIKD